MTSLTLHSATLWLSGILPLIALLLLLIAAYTDVRSRRISNWVSVALFVDFCLVAALGIQKLDFWTHLAWGGATLAVLLPLFAAEKIGGGDVKLLSAAVIWGGPIAGFEFLILTSLLGGGLALLALSPLAKTVWEWMQARFGIPDDILIFPTRESVPYGVAISLAGCFVITRVFVL